jgi:hypothetical protein
VAALRATQACRTAAVQETFLSGSTQTRSDPVWKLGDAIELIFVLAVRKSGFTEDIAGKAGVFRSSRIGANAMSRRAINN